LDLRFIVFSIEKLRGIHLLSRVRANVEIHKSDLFTRTKTQSDAVVWLLIHFDAHSWCITLSYMPHHGDRNSKREDL